MNVPSAIIRRYVEGYKDDKRILTVIYLLVYDICTALQSTDSSFNREDFLKDCGLWDMHLMR